MTSLPLSVAVPPPDLSGLDKLSDRKVEELYFDAARRLWDAASRLNQDTGCRQVADIIAPTLGLPPRLQIKTWKQLLISLQAPENFSQKM